MKYLYESFNDFLNERNASKQHESLCEDCGGKCDTEGICESCGKKHEEINEARKYDVLASIKDIRNFNRSKGSVADLTSMIKSILKNLGYKNTDDNYDAAEDHILASMDDDEKIPEDKDLVEELYDILESVSVNEARVQYKRRYTENHPARTMNSNTKIRSKFLSAIGDGVLTEDEIYNILKELNANSKWFKRNSSLVKQTADGYRLSVEGRRMLKHVQVANTVNEENPVIESKDLKAQAFDALKKMKDPTDESKPFNVKSVDSVKNKNRGYEVKYTTNKGKKESILLYDFDLNGYTNESFIANPDDAVKHVIDNYKKITGSEYNPKSISDKEAGKIERFVKKQKLDTEMFWDSWIEYNHV